MPTLRGHGYEIRLFQNFPGGLPRRVSCGAVSRGGHQFHFYPRTPTRWRTAICKSRRSFTTRRWRLKKAARRPGKTPRTPTARIQALEQTIAAQHAADLEVAQKNQQSMFMLAGAFGLTVLAAVLFMAYLQWRSVARLVEIASRPGAALASAGAVHQLAAPGRATVEVSNARLLDIVGQLEKKILELESGGRLLAEPAAKSATRSPRGRHFSTRTKPEGAGLF